MAWTTAVSTTNVRTEYPLLVTAIYGDTRLSATIAKAEDEIEAVLRDRYELTDPGADGYVWRACLCLTLYYALNSAFGEQGFKEDQRSAVGAYWYEYDQFRKDVQGGRVKLSLTPATTQPAPAVHNLDLGESSYSQFDLDSNHEKGFPLVNDE